MPFYRKDDDVKGKSLDVQHHIAQCAVLAHDLLYATELKPGAASFSSEFEDTKTVHFLAGGIGLFTPIFELAKRGILVAQNLLWYDDTELGFLIEASLRQSKAWYRAPGNTILGTLIMFAPLTVGMANSYAMEGMKVSSQLDLEVVTGIAEQFLKNSSTEDCVMLTKTLNDHVSKSVLHSDKEEDDFNSFIETYKHERTNLYEFTKFYESRDLIFSELANRYQISLKYGYPTFMKVYEESADFQKSIAQTFLTLLAEKKDTHLAKRFGNEIASEVNNQAKKIVKSGGIFTDEGLKKTEELDHYMKTSREKRINAGSIADLTATTIFIALIQGYRP